MCCRSPVFSLLLLRFVCLYPAKAVAEVHYRCVYECITIIKNKKFMKQKLLNLWLLTVMVIVGSSGAWAEKGDQTTNADINFDGATVSNKTITGTVGSMTWASEWTLKPYIQDNILRFGNTDGQVVSLQNNTINNKDSVTITFDLAFGKLSGKHVGFELRDKDGTAFITQWFDAYNGDFDDCNPLNLNWSSMYRGSNEPIQERCVYFTIGINYAKGKISTHTKCFMGGTSKPVTEADYSADFDATKILGSFVLTGNINNAGRYSTFDNLKIVTTEGDYSAATANYTVKWDCSGTTVKELNRSGDVGSSISISSTDKQSFEIGEKRYIYVSDDASGKTITSGNATIVTITVREANKYNYSVTSSYNNTALPFVENGWVWEDLNTITVYYPRFQAVGNQLVERAPVSNDLTTSITVTGNNFATDIAYTAVSSVDNLYLLSEAENLVGTGLSTNATIFTSRVSNKLIAHGASGNLLTISDPGTYVFTLGAIGGDNSSHKVKYNVNAGSTPIISDYEVTGNFLSLKQSNEFTVSNSPVVISFTCSDPASSRGIDLVYVQRTGDAPAPAILAKKAELSGNLNENISAKLEGNTLTIKALKESFGITKVKLLASELGTVTANAGTVEKGVWTGNAKEVVLTLDGTDLNSVSINGAEVPEGTGAATISEFKTAANADYLTLSGADILDFPAEGGVIVQDDEAGILLNITLPAVTGKKITGKVYGTYDANALVSSDYTDCTQPNTSAGNWREPKEMTVEDAIKAANVYRLVVLKGVTIDENNDVFTATDKTGAVITVNPAMLTLVKGDVLASLTGITYPDGKMKATEAQSGLLWKADDIAAGQSLPVNMTDAAYVSKLADVAMGDVIAIETLGAGTLDVQNAAGQSIVKLEMTQDEDKTLHFPVTADVVSDIQKHGLVLAGEGMKAVMAYKVPGMYAANMNENTIWYSNDVFAQTDRVTLGAIHFPDVREGDKLENKVLTSMDATFQQDNPYVVVSVNAVVDFEKVAVRDDKAEAKEGEEFAQGGYQSTNGMVMSFGGLTEGQSYSFKEAYPAVNKFAAVTEGIDQFPVDNNNKAYDPAQGNVPTKGTFYVFNPTKDGVVNVTVDLEKGKKLYVTENGEAFGEYMGITEVHDNTISFSVEAGNTYHLFANETNLKYYGFTFTPNDPAAMDVANSIYVFKRLGNVKNAKLMLEDAQVTYIKGDNVFVEDASGAIDLFQTLIQFYVGQKLNGYIFGENIKDFPMLLRTNETPNSQFKAEMGTAQSKTITVAEAKKREAMFRFVTLKNLKLAKDKQGFKVLIDEVGDTIYIEDTFNVLYELPNKIKRIEGIIGFNNEGVHYIWPTSKEGIVPADEPATLETGKYYLKNVGSGLFWGAGNDWGTRGSLVKHAEFVTLHDQGDGVYKMETQVSNGGTAYYFEGDYMDNANPMSLSINKTKTEGVYTIASPEEKLFGYDGTSTVLGKNVADGENAQWQILSEADMQATLSAAAADAPVDATFLILDPNFGRNNRNQSAWTVSEDCTNKNLSGGNNTNNCAESYMSVFTISQTIDVPNGKYVLNAQAAVTFHDNREIKEYDGNGYPQIFANDKVSNFNDMIVEDRLSNMGKLSEQFTAGMYTVEPIEVIVTDGKLTIGAKSERADIWAIWDNFELTYYGPANADGVLLQLDFENGEAADYWQKGVGYLVTPEFEGTTGQAASIKSGSDRGDYILTEANYAGVEDYNIDLDFAICKGSKTAFFAVMSESSWIFTYTWNNWGYFWKTTTTSDGQVHNPYLFELTIPSGTTAYINEQYDAQETGLANVNGGTWEFTEKNWYHLSLKVKADTKTVGYTVTDKATGAQALNGTYTMRDGESIYMKGIYERNNRVNADPGAILFDNIVVSTGSGPVTAIETVNAETAVRFAEGVYNLRGQKVGNSLQGLKKGLYIVNGKKVSVK